MKKITFILLIIFSQSYAQTNDDLGSFLTQIRQSPIYSECQTFKTTLESQTKEMSGKLSFQQTTDLQNAYTAIWQKYDLFLKTIKKDLIGSQNVQTFESNANTYQNLLTEIKADYDSKFTPIYQSVIGGKDITEDLLNIGVGLIKNLVQKIKTKKIEKKESLNLVLKQINSQFYNNLRMKSWSELDLVSNASANGRTAKIEEVNIPAPTLDAMEGSIKFLQIVDGQEIAMDFMQHNGKDIVVDGSTNSNYKTPYFTSTNQYSVGTKFKIEANSDVFIYVLVLNSTGVKSLHPNVQYVQFGKDIELTSESSPTTGRFILPEKGAFTIVADKNESEKNSEDFALIISKSELIMEETIEKLNALSGSLDERFSQVFGEQQITFDEAQVQNSGNQFSFSYKNQEKNILPLVFKILK
jgi:hypothetical protein